MRSIIPPRYLFIVPLVASLSVHAGEARKPRVPLEELVAVELSAVGTDPISGEPVAILVEPKSGDIVPVAIDAEEASAIIMAMHHTPADRPMPHDLIADIMAASGLRLQRLLIDGFEEGTYFGALELRTRGGREPIFIDARPSDGLALAARERAAILMAPAVLKAARSMGYGTADEQVVSAAGVTVVAASDEARRESRLGDKPGVLVTRSEGEAREAGLRAGALIVAVNGAAPHTPLEFLDLVQRTPADRKVRISFTLDGEDHEAELAVDAPDPDVPEFKEAEPQLEV
jgi:bifunctional DNase/RNase